MDEITGTLKISIFIQTPSRSKLGGRIVKRTLVTEYCVTQERAKQIRQEFNKNNYGKFGSMALWGYWQADPVEIR